MKKFVWKWDILFESLKEPIRLILLALISWLIVAVVPQLDKRYVPVLLLILRWLDKFVHEYRSEKGTEGLWRGLVGF